MPKMPQVVIDCMMVPIGEKQKKTLQIYQLVNKAHAIMLVEERIITKKHGADILEALLEIDKEGENFKIDPSTGELYMNLERKVVELAGEDSGGRMHTGRSRNDMGTCIDRIVVRNRLLSILQELNNVRDSLISRSNENYDVLMPGFTHTQPAQPTILGHYLLAISDLMQEDFIRIKGAYQRINLNPLGGAAFAGTGWPINRIRTAELLGFEDIVENSLVCVSDRSSLIEALSTLAILMTNISRFAGDLITWSTPTYGMVELDDSFTGGRKAGGSSIMPQKKNPIPLEIIRSVSGEVNGGLIKALTVTKGLPSGVNMDLYDTIDFEVLGSVHSALRLLNGVVSTLIVHKKRMAQKTSEGFTVATEIADTLVREKGVTFRTAHGIVAGAVEIAREQGQENLSTEMINQVSEKIVGKPVWPENDEIPGILQCVVSRKSTGGAFPAEVQRMSKKRSLMLKADHAWVEDAIERIKNSESKLNDMVNQVIASA